MRFYQGLLPAIIWDKAIGGPIVEFNDGILDTEDEKIIELLTEKGYLVEKDLEILEAGGTLPHGGFEKEGTSVDHLLPSGRPPMDNPEIAGGQPHGKKVETTGDNLPASENQEVAKARITPSGNIIHGSDGGTTANPPSQVSVTEEEAAQRAIGKRPRKKTTKKAPAKKAPAKKTAAKKVPAKKQSKAAAKKPRVLKRRTKTTKAKE